jgi:hypothetical protein
VLALSPSAIPRIAIENPVSVLSTRWRKPDQIVQSVDVWAWRDKDNVLVAKGAAQAGSRLTLWSLSGRYAMTETVHLSKKGKAR